jgi:hypothetical protein
MKCTSPSLPAWAKTITVEKLEPADLKICGEGRELFPILGLSREPIQIYDHKSKRPVHLQFVDARTDDQLLQFVRTWGPIRGEVRTKPRHENRGLAKPKKGSLLVVQEMGILRREQQLFSAAVKLLGEVRRPKPDAQTIGRLVTVIARQWPCESSSERMRMLGFQNVADILRYASLLAPRANNKTEGARREHKARLNSVQYNAVSAAHCMLCILLNRFPLRFTPSTDGAILLPAHDPRGILPILYFLLWTNYKDQHCVIKTCKQCNKTFIPGRGDSDFDDRRCYKKYNDRERYLKKKSAS